MGVGCTLDLRYIVHYIVLASTSASCAVSAVAELLLLWNLVALRIMLMEKKQYTFHFRIDPTETGQTAAILAFCCNIMHANHVKYGDDT